MSKAVVPAFMQLIILHADGQGIKPLQFFSRNHDGDYTRNIFVNIYQKYLAHAKHSQLWVASTITTTTTIMNQLCGFAYHNTTWSMNNYFLKSALPVPLSKRLWNDR